MKRYNSVYKDFSSENKRVLKEMDIKDSIIDQLNFLRRYLNVNIKKSLNKLDDMNLIKLTTLLSEIISNLK
ncbi:MAG: hypothetical protein PHF86_14305 [Candidatus Nanoarchaeia archaeon]|jgi:hypothetical protein|nr:hypothetical protein [Candidatus Nanoarchaeia archaeon]